MIPALLLLAVAASPSQGSALERANEAYQSFELDEARGIIEEAVRTEVEPRARVELLELLATVYLARDDFDEAVTVYRQVLQLDPRYVGPEYPSPKIRRALREARLSLPSPPSSTATTAIAALPPPETPSPSLVSSPWFWVAVGAAAAAIGAGAYVAYARAHPSPPDSTYGPFQLH